MQDDTPLYAVMFDMQINLCERFPAMTPLTVRREKAREVFILIRRLNEHSILEQQKNPVKLNNKGNESTGKIIRKRAGDDWF